MSTTRPLASEMTGTSRETSGKTEPVAVNSAADSILRGGGKREFGRVLGVDGDQVHVGHLNDLGRRRRAIALRLCLCSRRAARHEQRSQSKADEIAGSMTSMQKMRDSLNYLASHSKIQLSGSGQIGADQLQIGQLHGAIVALRIEKVHQRSAAVLVG